MDAGLSPLQAVGFLLAAWAVIGNDSLQTLGPFLQANRQRASRPLQAFYLCALLCGVLLLGWWRHAGDASWGRLAAYPAPACFSWAELLPPVAVLLLTQAGVPVSTSFLVLTAFTPANLPALLQRSLLGYGLALAAGLLVYGVFRLWCRSRPPERDPFTAATAEAAGPAAGSPAQPGLVREGASLAAGSSPAERLASPALALLWLASGWLWSQWLIQDLANIFIVLPRQLDGAAMAVCLTLLCAGVCLLLAEGGGVIQDIVQRKCGLTDPRASAALSLLYGAILAGLALWSPEPLSTTWVFLGLLAGRELALRLEPRTGPLASLAADLGRDLALAGLGLAVSLAVALLVQPLRCTG